MVSTDRSCCVCHRWAWHRLTNTAIDVHLNVATALSDSPKKMMYPFGKGATITSTVPDAHVYCMWRVFWGKNPFLSNIGSPSVDKVFLAASTDVLTLKCLQTRMTSSQNKMESQTFVLTPRCEQRVRYWEKWTKFIMNIYSFGDKYCNLNSSSRVLQASAAIYKS